MAVDVAKKATRFHLEDLARRASGSAGALSASELASSGVPLGHGVSGAGNGTAGSVTGADGVQLVPGVATTDPAVPDHELFVGGPPAPDGWEGPTVDELDGWVERQTGAR